MKDINNDVKEIVIENLKTVSGGAHVGVPMPCPWCKKPVYFDELVNHGDDKSLYCPYCDGFVFEGEL